MPEPLPPQQSRGATLLILLVCVALVLGGSWLLTHNRVAAGPTTPVSVPTARAALRVGEPIPELSATGVDGRQVSLSALRGRPLWLTFGATWCAPCRAEAPDLQAAYAAHRDRANVVAVYLSEQPADVQRYATLLGLTYTHVPDPDSRVAGAYGVNGIPVHFFVDSAGVLRERREGALSRQAMDEALARIGG